MLDSMIYYLTSGVFCYAKRSTKQTIHTRIKKAGGRNGAEGKAELSTPISEMMPIAAKDWIPGTVITRVS